MIHHVIGFIQIPRTQWVGIYTLCYRIMKYPCLSYEPKQIFIFCLSRIHFVIKDTTLMKAWQRASILLSPYSSHIYSCCWYHQMVANHLSNQCLAHLRTECRLKSTVVWYLPLDTYEGRCSTDIFYHMSTKSMHGSKRSCCTLLLAVAIVVIRCYRHLIHVSPAWDHGIKMTRQIREPCILFTSLYTT